jgi:two-component system, response regulator PdtaR
MTIRLVNKKMNTDRVLIVEDEAGLRFVVSEFLREEAGLDVVEAESADSALQLLRTGDPFSVVFTDVRMPGTIDGLGLARCIQEEFPGLPIIVASGNLMPEERLSGVPFMTKPYGFDGVYTLSKTRFHSVTHRYTDGEPTRLIAKASPRPYFFPARTKFLSLVRNASSMNGIRSTTCSETP